MPLFFLFKFKIKHFGKKGSCDIIFMGFFMFKYSEQYVPIGAKEDAYISQKNQILKEEFSRFISGSDLIRIKSKILELLDADLLKFYPSPKNLYATVCNMAEDVDYDICQHILGVHNFMSYGKTLEEKNALLKRSKVFFAK